MRPLTPRRLTPLALAIGLIAGCSTQAPPAQPPAGAPPQAAPTTAPAAPAPTSPPPVAAQAAQPTVAPAAPKAAAPSPSPVAAAKVEPKGKLTYALHFALTPRWLDPSVYNNKSDYIIAYALHDALVRPYPGNRFTPSLAESYEVAPDFRSATFKLRSGPKFHNGDPVTSEDVKFTFEKYQGTSAKALQSKTERIEIPDSRTVRFVFNEPFVDFLDLYGEYGSGAGWILPAKYYQQIGADAFKLKPIGAGPYKFVSQVVGESVELEAFTDYWRKSPTVKTVVFKGIPETTTRLAALQVGEVDAIAGVLPLQAEQIKADPKLQLGPAQSTNYAIEFLGREKPTSPFADKRVRQAVSLALDRKAIIQFHTGGLGENPGNWVTRDFAGALDLPPPEENLAKAKQLLAEAGHPNGFDAGTMTPFPPNGPLGDFVMSQLREVGIRAKLNTMERAAFDQKRAEGVGAFPDGLMIPSIGSGSASTVIRDLASCKGSGSRTCEPYIEERLLKLEKTVNLAEREQLLKEIQLYTLEEYIFVPFLRNVFVNAQGPRIANKPEEIWGSFSGWLYLGPFEDVRLKD